MASPTSWVRAPPAEWGTSEVSSLAGPTGPSCWPGLAQCSKRGGASPGSGPDSFVCGEVGMDMVQLAPVGRMCPLLFLPQLLQVFVTLGIMSINST